MPFTTYDKISNFLPKAFQSILQQANIFDNIEAAASEIVSNITGMDIPSDASNSPNWVHYPISCIIKKNCLGLYIHKIRRFTKRNCK